MENVKILSPGEKIKRIRKNYKLKQSEIAGEDISRNLISLIENNKAPLTIATAAVIANNINKVLKTKSIDFTITSSELLESTSNQINKLINTFINELHKNKSNSSYNIDASLENIEPYLHQYASNNKRAEAYKEIGSFYINKKLYEKAYIYYFKAYESMDFQENKETYLKIVINLSTCCYKLNKYEEGLDIIISLERKNLDMDSLYKYNYLYNKALIYKSLQSYNNSNKTLETIEEMSLSLNEIFEIYTMKASNYSNLKLYEKALYLQKTLYSKVEKKDSTKKLVILCNIIDIYKKLNDIKNINKYLELAVNHLDNYSINTHSYYSNLIYYNLGTAAMFVFNNELSINLLDETLNWAKENNDYSMMFKCINELFTLYSQLSMENELIQLKTSLLELLSKDNKIEYQNLVYKYLYMFTKNNQNDDVIGLLQFMLNI